METTSDNLEEWENMSAGLTELSDHRKIGFFQHYHLLLWKSFLLRRRQRLFLISELLLPLIILLVLVGMRHVEKPTVYPPCHITSQPLPSMGFYTYLRSLICSPNLTCTAYDDDRSNGNIFGLPTWLNDLADLSQSDWSGLPDMTLAIQLLSEDTLRKSLEQATAVGNDPTLTSTMDLIEALGCDEKTFSLLSVVTSQQHVTTLARAYCLLPVRPRRLLRNALEGRLAASGDSPFTDADRLLGAFSVLASAYSSIRSTDQTANKTRNMTALLEAVKLISIPVCGSRPGQNDFLNLADLLSTQNGKLPMGSSKDITSTLSQYLVDVPTNATACSAINAIFAAEPMRPLTLRLKTLMQGRILYHPVTPLTQRIVNGANQTTRMFERLKIASSAWVSMEAEVLPKIFVNSTLVRQLRRLATVCLLLPNLPANVTESCRRLKYFLQEDKRPPTEPDANTTSYLHWSDLIEPIRALSAAVDNILSSCINYDRFVGYSNSTLMEETAENLSVAGQPVMMLFFDEAPATSADLSDLNSTLLTTRLRLPVSLVDPTGKFRVLDVYSTPPPRNRLSDSMKYFTSGFIDVQEQIARSYIRIVGGQETYANGSNLYSNLLLPVEMKFVPGPCYQVDPMLHHFAFNLPMITVIIWICTVVFAVRAIVYEKECRLKEFTKIMGMGNLVHWLNWWTISSVMMGASSLCAALLLKFGGIYPNGDFFVILCSLLAYLWAIIPQAFFVSVFYTKTDIAAVVSGLSYFIMFLPYALVLLYYLDYKLLSALSFCPQVALALAFFRLGDLERTGQGAQWNNLWGTELTSETFTLGNCLVMLFIDGLLAFLCTAYLEAVLPSTYGVPRRWYFLFTGTFWKDVCDNCCCRLKKKSALSGDLPPSSASSLSLSSSYMPQQASSPQVYDQFHEPPPDKHSVGVSIRGLTKTYRGGKQTAVNNLWADFYEGQITSFLGHNGAGKTTTMSILTGIYPASSGDAYICGKNIRTEMSAIRTFLGLCPQHNILYDRLTVREHLRFYGSIKGLSKEELAEETNVFLQQLDLIDKADDLSQSLSGGQKRRLSLAAAFIGGSKIVFLDEPTAGVDPHSRRSIWQLILRFRSSRTIILTTHHMDEADVLGDRIVIISQGHLKASGSSLFLKSNFAKSYYLTVEKAAGEKSQIMLSSEEVDRQLLECLTGQLSGVQLITSNPTEWVFALPAQHALDGGCVEFFTFLDSNRMEFSERFGFAHYGLSDTTLEEIFLLLSEDPSEAVRFPLPEDGVKCHPRLRGRRRRHWSRGRLRPVENPPSETGRRDEKKTEEYDSTFPTNKAVVSLEESSNTGSIEESSQDSPTDIRFAPSDVQPLKGVQLYTQQMKACLVKRLRYVQRSKRGWFLEMVLPVCTVVILMASFKLDSLVETDLFGWDMLGCKITSLLLEAVLFFGAVLAIEYNSARCRCRRRSDIANRATASSSSSLEGWMDQDVMEERLRVYTDESNLSEDIIRVKGVTKCYPRKKLPAVDNLTFGVRPGECFGLLGVNGAGKTTTFNMLTTSIKPDRGEIWVNGYNLKTDAHKAHAQIGYCPQFDALHSHLTGYETLLLYARIRGFPENDIKPIVDALIDRMSLRPHANKKASAYSGGNLRKLSTAVAILGNPRVLLLDEPTSGMDPGAKRYLWGVLKSLLRDNCSIVLTSHSMEECEALCNRVGIMVAGQFQCFGTVPRLKERFGEGYIVEVDVRAPAERVTESLRVALGEENVHLTESVGQRLTFQTSMQVPLAALFKHLVAERNAGEVNTFAVRQASLDSVFINFIRLQTDAKAAAQELMTGNEELEQDCQKDDVFDWYENNDETPVQGDHDRWIAF
nr:unnamed protein product [Spirometra erinaceieuropaei]